MRFTITGPAPSWKNHRRIVTNPATGKRRMIKSEVCERWLRDALFELRSQRNEQYHNRAFPVREPVSVELMFYYKSKKRPDLDNAVGGPLDALQQAGILKNDSLVYSLTAEVYNLDAKDAQAFCSIEIRSLGRVDKARPER